MSSDPARAFRLDGRVAVVTGASSGIGAALARGLAAAGARVVVSARRGDRLEELTGALRALGAEAEPVPCDVARADEVERLARATEARFGPADVLVNAAGTV